MQFDTDLWIKRRNPEMIQLFMITDAQNSCLVPFDDESFSLFRDLHLVLSEDVRSKASSYHLLGSFRRKDQGSWVGCTYLLYGFTWKTPESFRINEFAESILKNSIHKDGKSESCIQDTQPIRGPIFLCKESEGKFQDMTNEDVFWLLESHLQPKSLGFKCSIL